MSLFGPAYNEGPLSFAARRNRQMQEQALQDQQRGYQHNVALQQNVAERKAIGANLGFGGITPSQLGYANRAGGNIQQAASAYQADDAAERAKLGLAPRQTSFPGALSSQQFGPPAPMPLGALNQAFGNAGIATARGQTMPQYEQAGQQSRIAEAQGVTVPNAMASMYSGHGDAFRGQAALDNANAAAVPGRLTNETTLAGSQAGLQGAQGRNLDAQTGIIGKPQQPNTPIGGGRYIEPPPQLRQDNSIEVAKIGAKSRVDAARVAGEAQNVGRQIEAIVKDIQELRKQQSVARLRGGDANIDKQIANKEDEIRKLQSQGSAGDGGAPQDAVNELLADPSPERIAQFEQVFGQGSAARYVK